MTLCSLTLSPVSLNRPMSSCHPVSPVSVSSSQSQSISATHYHIEPGSGQGPSSSPPPCGAQSNGEQGGISVPYQRCFKLTNRGTGHQTPRFNTQSSPTPLVTAIKSSKENRSRLSLFASKQELARRKRNLRFKYDYTGEGGVNDLCTTRKWNNDISQFVPEYIPYLNKALLAKKGSSCRGCDNLSSLGEWNLARSIYRSNGVPSSMLTDKVAGLAVANSTGNLPPRFPRQTLSDRNNAAVVKRLVPTRGNSTRGSITRMRPGSTSAVGVGSDVKHGSYERRLLKLKGRMLLGRASQSLSSKFAVSKAQNPAITSAKPVYTNLTGVWSGAPLPGVVHSRCKASSSCDLISAQ